MRGRRWCMKVMRCRGWLVSFHGSVRRQRRQWNGSAVVWQWRNVVQCKLGWVEVVLRNTCSRMCVDIYKWITKHSVLEFKIWGCNDVFPDLEDSCEMLRSTTHFSCEIPYSTTHISYEMSCEMLRSATHFVGDTTHPQIANRTKFLQILYKSKNISYIPQIILKCVAIEGLQNENGQGNVR